MTNPRQRAVAKMAKEEILYKLLKKEIGYYKAILELTEQENGALTRERPIREITTLMKKRKVLLNCVDEIDQALRPVKNLWVKNKDPNSPFAPKVEEKLVQLSETIGEILSLDNENQQLLKQALTRLKKTETVQA
jgi:hypothetical protein